MRSHDQSRDGSNLIETILYFPKVDFLLIIHHRDYLTFLVNLPNLLFKSIF